MELEGNQYIPSNQKIKKILERYGLKGIKYKNGIPDFSDVVWKTVQVQGMAEGKKKEQPRNINFPLAFNELSN